MAFLPSAEPLTGIVSNNRTTAPDDFSAESPEARPHFNLAFGPSSAAASTVFSISWSAITDANSSIE